MPQAAVAEASPTHRGAPATFTIAALAAEFGLTTRAIRFYERNGFGHAGDEVNPTSGRPVLKMMWRP